MGPWVLQIQGGRSGHLNVRESAERRKARARTGQMGGIALALQSAALSEDALLVCDNDAVLCAIKKWVGRGGKATLATAPDADFLREIVCLLTQRNACEQREILF
jgi:hypothetical protein